MGNSVDEEDLVLVRCTQPFVRTVVKSARFPSSLPKEGRFTAESAGRSGDSEEVREHSYLAASLLSIQVVEKPSSE